MPDQAEGHQRDGDVGDEPARVAHDLKHAEVFAFLRVAETRLEEGQAGMAQRLVHRDVEGEGARAFLERHVASEALGRLGSGIFLVRELIQLHRERDVVAGATEGEFVGLPGVFEGLRVERLGEIEVEGPGAERLVLRLQLHDGRGSVGLVVVIAFRQRFVGQLGSGTDTLGGLEGEAVGHLRFRAEHRVRVVGLDHEGVGRAREFDGGRRLLGGDVAQDRIRDGDDGIGCRGFLDERDFEFTEGLGVVSLFAFGDDHRGLLLVDCRDEATAQ